MRFRRRLHRLLSVLVFSVSALALATTASAVIKVELPVSMRFARANSIVVGKVSATDAEHRLITVAAVEQVKGDPAGQTFRIQFSPAFNLFDSIKIDQPVVLLAGQKASIHISDTWLLAVRVGESNPPIWRISQIDNNAAGKTFPGTTTALARALEEFKAGKSTLLDSFEAKSFTGGVKEIAKLDVTKPTSLVVADINGDAKPDLIVTTPAGVKLFLAAAGGYTDATEKWGLKGVVASTAAAGDIAGDGKIALLLDGTLYLNDGQKFTPSPAIKLDADAHPLACALGDYTGAKQRDAAILLADGRLLVFKNDGQSAKPWAKAVDRKLSIGAGAIQSAAFGDFSDSGPGVMVLQENAVTFFPLKENAPAADFTRLTGDALNRIKGFAGGLKNAVATPLDINGDHRPDLLITADGAAMVLINRGFGTFLPDSDAGAEASAAAAKIAPALSSIRARAALSKGGDAPDDLLLLSDEGHLFLATNPASGK